LTPDITLSASTATVPLAAITAIDPRRPVYFYGAGRLGALLFEAIGDPRDWNFRGFVDSHRGGELCGYPVLLFAQFRERYVPGDQIVITSNHVEAIVAALSQLGVPSAFDANVWYQTSANERGRREYDALMALLAADRAGARAPAEFVARIGELGAALRRGLAETAATHGSDLLRAALLLDIFADVEQLTRTDSAPAALLRENAAAARSRDLLQAATLIDPGDGRAHFCLARRLELDGETDAAIERYLRAGQVDPALRGAAALRVALILHRRGDDDAARPHFATARELGPGLGEYRFAVAAALGAAGSVIDALDVACESLGHERFAAPEFAGVNRPIGRADLGLRDAV
jgi:tetratricopeptide (TPR) repeat protein